MDKNEYRQWFNYPILIFCLLFAACTNSSNKIITINGEINASELGVTLEHEHILVDFARGENNLPEDYTYDEVFEKVLPYINNLEQYGVRSFIECTPAFLGRDINLLKEISEKNRLTNHHQHRLLRSSNQSLPPTESPVNGCQ